MHAPPIIAMVSWVHYAINYQSMSEERERKMERSGPENRVNGSVAGVGREKIRWNENGREQEDAWARAEQWAGVTLQKEVWAVSGNFHRSRSAHMLWIAN